MVRAQSRVGAVIFLMSAKNGTMENTWEREKPCDMSLVSYFYTSFDDIFFSYKKSDFEWTTQFGTDSFHCRCLPTSATSLFCPLRSTLQCSLFRSPASHQATLATPQILTSLTPMYIPGCMTRMLAGDSVARRPGKQRRICGCHESMIHQCGLINRYNGGHVLLNWIVKSVRLSEYRSVNGSDILYILCRAMHENGLRMLHTIKFSLSSIGKVGGIVLCPHLHYSSSLCKAPIDLLTRAEQ